MPKMLALVFLSFSVLTLSDGQAMADVNFAAPGVAESVTGLVVDGTVYDVAFVGNISHSDWANQLFPGGEDAAEAAIVELAAELNAAGATTARFTTPGGTFDFTTGQLWHSADANSLFGESLIRSGGLWRLANPLPGGSTAPLNGAFPFALEFTPGSAPPVPSFHPPMFFLLIGVLCVVGLVNARHGARKSRSTV